jgi:hypothetical protein
MNELDALQRRMWGREFGRWKVSYAHLAHDMANAPLELEHLERYVSRSRRQALFEAAQEEMERLRSALQSSRQHYAGIRVPDDRDEDGILSADWWGERREGVYADDDEELLLADPFAEEGYEWDPSHWWVASPRVRARAATAAIEEAVERRAVTMHRWGQRLSGIVFSRGVPTPSSCTARIGMGASLASATWSRSGLRGTGMDKRPSRGTMPD